MNETEFARGVAAALEVYPQARLLPPRAACGRCGWRRCRSRPRSGAAAPPACWWCSTWPATTAPGRGGCSARSGSSPAMGRPYNASAVFEFGEAWQGFSWNFAWPPALGVVETIEAYLGRFSDHR